MRFTGKTVVVTGGASGIGAATAQTFAREGATVFLADIDRDGGERIAASHPDAMRFQACDVCDPAALRALMERAAAETGGIDVVVGNAGAGGARAAIDEIEPEDWDRTFHLLLRSVAFGIRYAAPHMRGRPGANFVNVSSVAAVGPGYSPSAYAVAKAGVLHLTKTAAADLARYGIRVNAVQPGFINTNIFTASLGLPDAMKEGARNAIRQMSSAAQPVRRAGEAQDIANAIAFLASDQASFVNGTSLIVDGGLTIGPRHSWDEDVPGVFATLEALEQQYREQAAAAGAPSAAPVASPA